MYTCDMEPTGPEQNEQAQEASKKDTVFVTLRAPLFSYLANSLAPIYKKEFDELQQDGSFKGIQEFHHSPFGTLMGQILDTATAQKEMELPKVTLHVNEEQMKAAREKMQTPFDAAGRMLYSQMMGELNDEYRTAKITKKIQNAKRKVKSLFGK